MAAVFREYTQPGCLFSYGPTLLGMFTHAGEGLATLRGRATTALAEKQHWTTWPEQIGLLFYPRMLYFARAPFRGDADPGAEE
jgi:hypothetical protein